MQYVAQNCDMHGWPAYASLDTERPAAAIIKTDRNLIVFCILEGVQGNNPGWLDHL